MRSQSMELAARVLRLTTRKESRIGSCPKPSAGVSRASPIKRSLPHAPRPKLLGFLMAISTWGWVSRLTAALDQKKCIKRSCRGSNKVAGARRPDKGNDMATSQMSEVLQHLRRAVFPRDEAGLTDGQLLRDYTRSRDETALAALVHRHGPMVWGVCRRVLGDRHDAEDAFQATFLVLVRKSESIASPELVANWLYGVAHQTALKARATTAKRKARERQVTQMPEPAVAEQDLWNDLQPLLDQELSRLPDMYRVAIVLCDLEGMTRKEAARRLGLPEGTLAARLARGRVLLAKRLTRYGLAVSGGALAAVLAPNAASAGVPTSVVNSTIQAASIYAAGQEATGVIS